MNEILKNHIGDYLKLGGHGIMDGMKSPATKTSVHKIIAVAENGDIILRNYRAKKNCVLPVYSQNQEWGIIRKNLFRTLETY